MKLTLFRDTPAPQCSPEEAGSTKSLRSLRLEHCRVIDMVKLMERRGVIDVRKRFILRNGDAQERAERLPPLLDVKDQQPVRGNRLAHRLNVLGKDGLAMRAIREPTVEGAGVDDVPRPLGPLVVPQGENRLLNAVVPALADPGR